jgi:hypothetical protein
MFNRIDQIVYNLTKMGYNVDFSVYGDSKIYLKKI